MIFENAIIVGMNHQSSTPGDGLIAGADADGANISSPNFTLQGGRGTGTGTAGTVTIQVGRVETTGTTLHSLVNLVTLTSIGVTIENYNPTNNDSSASLTLVTEGLSSPGNNYGNGILSKIRSTTTSLRDACRIVFKWFDSTDASRRGKLELAVNGVNNWQTGLTITAATSGSTPASVVVPLLTVTGAFTGAGVSATSLTIGSYGISALGALTVSTGYFSGLITANAGINCIGTLAVTGAITCTGNLSTDADLDVDGDANVDGVLTTGGTKASAYRSSNQAIGNGSWTNFVFDSEITDSLNEYNTTTGVFVPAETGTYLMRAFFTQNTTNRLILGFWEDTTTQLSTFADQPTAGLGGVIFVDLVSGTSYRFRVFSSGGTTVLGGLALTSIFIRRMY